MGSQSAGTISEQFDLFLRSWKAQDGSNKYITRIDRMIADGQSSVIVDYEDLLSFDTELATSLIENPDRMLELFREAAIQVVRTENLAYAESIEKQIQVRIAGLIDKLPLRGVSAKYLDRLVAVNGMVVRTSEIKPRVIVAAFSCPNEHITYVQQPGGLLKKPDKCSECGESREFKLETKMSRFTDYQVIRLQELPEELPPGQLPQSIDAELLGDLVNRARPGDRIVITGIVRAEPETGIGAGKQSTFRTRLDANYIDVRGKELEQIQITPEDEAAIRRIAESPHAYEDLVRSIAPAIYGMEAEKEAALLLVAGAPQRTLPDGTTLRGDINALIVGDPGCLVADERILLSDGSIIKIGNAGRGHLQKIELRVLSPTLMNPDGKRLEGKLEEAEATTFHVYRGQRVIEVVTESGRSIKGTHNHPLLVYNSASKRAYWKRLDHLKVGDRLVVVSRLPCRVRDLVPTGFSSKAMEKVKVPSFYDTRFASLLGYMLARGFYGNEKGKFGFHANGKLKRNMILLFKKLFELSPSSMTQGTVTYISKEAWEAFKEIQDRRVPDGILKSGNKVVRRFLKCFFEGAASFGRKAITIRSDSIELLRDIQLLLQRFAVHSKISSGLLAISGEDALLFSRSISHVYRMKTAQTVQHRRSHFIFEKVVSIIDSGEVQDVYDIEVPRVHSFIANGVVSHNTGKSELLKYVARLAPRGLYTSGRGSTAAGLCVAPGTIVVTPSGLVRIDHLAEKELRGKEVYLKSGEVVADDPERAELLTPSLMEASVLQKRGNEVVISESLLLDSCVFGSANQYYRVKTEKSLRIETKLGKEIEVTPETRLASFDKATGSVVWKRAGDLKEEDYIVMTSFIPSPGEEFCIKPEDILEGNELLEFKMLGQLGKKKLSYEEAVRECSRLGIDFTSHVWPAVKTVRSKDGRYYLSLPSDSASFLYFIGFILTRSSISSRSPDHVTIKCHTEEANRIKRMLRELFLIHDYAQGKEEIRVTNPFLARLLRKVGIKEEGKAESLELSDRIWSSSNSQLASFLKGLFESNLNSRSLSSEIVEISLPSKQMAEQVDLALQRFGIICKLDVARKDGSEKITISICEGESLSRLSTYLGVKGTVCEHNKYANYDFSSSFKRLGPYLISVQVAKLKEEKGGVLYDLTVERGSSFIANGFVVHNTAAVVKEKSGLMMLEAGAVVLADLGVACLHPSTPILFNDKMVAVSDIAKNTKFEFAISKGEKVEVADLHGYVHSLELDKMKMARLPTTIIRRKSYKGSLLKITFKSGNQITLTPDHMLIDGDTLEWRPASEFKVKQKVVAPLSLPSHNERIWIWDILPDDAPIELTKEQKKELLDQTKNSFANPASLALAHKLMKKLQGRWVKFADLRQFTSLVGLESEWKKKIIKVGNDIPKKPYLTPELSYLIGFVFGDCYVTRRKNNSVQKYVAYPLTHKKSINRFAEFWNSCFTVPLKLHTPVIVKSKIRGKVTVSTQIGRYASRRPFYYIYRYITQKSLSNIFSLSDECLCGFLAGLFDADGRLSKKQYLKEGRTYTKWKITISVTNDLLTSRNLAMAFRRFGCLAFVRETRGNVIRISIANRRDCIRLIESLGRYSLKMSKEAERAVQMQEVSELRPALAAVEFRLTEKIGKNLLLQNGIWPTTYSYPKDLRNARLIQLQKIIDRTSPVEKVTPGRYLGDIISEDFFLDEIKEIDKRYYKGYVYDLYVPEHHNFVAGGIIVENCIDEFDKMRPDDRGVLHEVMEQQTVSVAKGGIVATLNARTSIVAAANPLLGTYDQYKNIYENVNLPIPLLSRFDIIFIVKDTPDRVQDEKLATHILRTHRSKGFVSPPPIDFDLLRKYIVYCKKIDPILTPEAEAKLLDFYLQMRSLGGRENMITVTPRQLESLIRLATARARLLLRDKVTEDDALVAISLVSRMLGTVGVDVKTGKIDIGVLQGRATSERNLIELAVEVFKELQGPERNPVSLNSFLDALEKTNKFSREEARKMVNTLYKMGQIYEIKPGYYSRIV